MAEVWRMRVTVRTPDGTVLAAGDVVEWFHAKRHRWLATLGERETALSLERQLTARAEGKAWLRPVQIVHRGKLHVVERQCITDRPPAGPKPVPAPPRRQNIQRELFD